MNIDTPARSKRHVAAQTGMFLFVFFFVLVIYTFLHEGGHALVGVLSGGRLTSFSINFFNISAHAGIDGDLSVFQRSLISIAGISTPYLIWAIWLLLTPSRTHSLLEALKVVSSLAVINSLLAWIVIPLLYLAGKTPSDDSTTFLTLTQAPPLLIAAGALFFYLAGWFLFRSRLEGGFRGLVQRLRHPADDLFQPENRRTFRQMVAICLLFGSTGIALSAIHGGASDHPIPSGYQSVTQISLAQRGYQEETVYEFDLEEKSSVSLYFELNTIHRGPVKISLSTPVGGEQVFFQDGSKFDAGWASINPKDLLLPAGKYQIVMTLPQDASGSVGVYMNVTTPK